jgi:hypothetical protein
MRCRPAATPAGRSSVMIRLGVTAQAVLAAYRVGDSPLSVLTPGRLVARFLAAQLGLDLLISQPRTAAAP